MKKLLLMVILGLFLSNVGFAKILILKNCDFERSKNVYEKYDIKINTSYKTINETRVYTDEWINSPDRTEAMSKISLSEFKLTFFDGDYAKGERFFTYRNQKRKSELNIDLKNKTIQNFFIFYPSQERSSSKLLKCR